ncbi:MAG: PAS domain-containing sensor histidine kinase [Arcobacter sp.]|jgi:PAS domain S-box-containing protein|uniref:sensor histidine kinase n=1 Tax=Arcobacter sp. TaxID=1872629 RepID=UPI002A75D18C|nr:PAS domain-containing sensor histidine kinase [Arcobacter sp.]MDY3199544.1 PAS domain-containing sensor histidine kinase [Arcobacter sp.]
MENFLEQIEKNKITIIRTWISFPIVLDLIKNNSIDENLFIRRYAFALIEHFILVVKKDEKTEKNSAVIDFLKYLRKQNIKINELFLLFSTFKNSLIEFAFKSKLETAKLIEEIDFYFEKIFSVLLDIYSKSIAQIENALNKSVDIVDKYVIMSRTDINGVIISVSNAFCKISGYESYEMIGKTQEFFKHPDMKAEFFNEIKKTIQSGNMWQGEIKNLKKNGGFYWLKTTIHPNFDNDGNIISYDAINEDISFQKELKNQQDLLVEQSKSAALGEMISMIAHQWRQPLQAVSILIQKLPLLKELKGEISDEMLNDVVSQVSNQLDYMSKTIDDFRDYFKPNKKKEEVYIENVINKSMDFLSYLFKINSIKVNYKNESTSKVDIFLNEMVQVFINLAKNSCDAMIEKNVENRVIDIYSYEKNKKLYIEFEDNAGGISDKVINKIFNPYFSTKSNKNGTGLGLYMSKTIIEQYSLGKINVYNTKIGTKFIIELPLK